MEKTLVKNENGFITFGDWTDFKDKLNTLQEDVFESEERLCQSLGFDKQFYQRMITFAVSSWKKSPSASIFNAIGKSGLTIQVEGEPVFDSYLTQTRFLTKLSEEGIIKKFFLEKVRDENGEKVIVRGTNALTVGKGERGVGINQRINEVLKMLYVYFLYCNKQEQKVGFKTPKKIYRGIRLRDILNNPAIKEALATLQFPDNVFSEKRRKIEYDCIVDYLKKNGIKEICEHNLVSFTSSKAVAKYFANNNGIIVEMNTRDVEIMTSEVHDERIAERDYVSNKLEKEYIVRLTDKKVEVSDISIHDIDYYIATNHPLAVSLFDHDDKSATYQLNGVQIKAYYVWTSNTTSTIRYKNMDKNDWGLSGREFKEQYGFSPVISNKNIKDIMNFQVHIKQRG